MDVWVEKYRPQKLKDMVLPEGCSRIVHNFVKHFDSSPHLLLHSLTPGTGKTSLAYVLANELDADLLRLNASDERGIQVIRDKVKRFAMTLSFTGQPKICFLDEADYLTAEAQASLRAMMEEYANNVKFILSCNELSRIIEPIQSRCIAVDFSRLPEDKVLERLVYILEQEQVEFDLEILHEIVKRFWPSLRNMVNELQRQFIEYGKINQKPLSYVFVAEKILQGLQEGINPFKLYNLIEDISDYERLLIDIVQQIMKSQELKASFKAKSIVLGAKYNYRQKVGADNHLQLLAFLMELYYEYQKEKKMAAR